MGSFTQRFEIIYKKYSHGLKGTGAKPNISAFARFLELPISTVKSWETRDAVPSGKDLKIIHDKLGFSYDWLISGEGEMFDGTEQEVAVLKAENARLRTELAFKEGEDKMTATDIGVAAGQR